MAFLGSGWVLFNSFEFILAFLPITLICFHYLANSAHPRNALTLLVISSLVFYAWGDYRFLPLLLGSVILNFTIGKRIKATNSKKVFAVGVVINLFVLGFFKYTSFILSIFAAIFDFSIDIPTITLPLGISFFTFTQIAFLVDTFRGETEEYSFQTYSLFVLIFPHLIAGPLLYHKHIIPQFNKAKIYIYTRQNFVVGLIFFVVGLCKKVIVADRMANGYMGR